MIEGIHCLHKKAIDKQTKGEITKSYHETVQIFYQLLGNSCQVKTAIWEVFVIVIYFMQCMLSMFITILNQYGSSWDTVFFSSMTFKYWDLEYLPQ